MELVKIPLPADVLYIMNKLRQGGYRADIVGGAVRDYILGRKAGDIDITTSATPAEMLEVFSDERVVETGLKHGTVSVILNHIAYEVTSYRIDGEYSDSRHPDAVKFTRDIREDLARRDFTVNAIAYNDIDGYTDAYGGIADIESRTIRAVGIAEERFSEDALRILRAIRFSATLGFKIEPETERALYTKAHLLSRISRERIFTEWMKLLGGAYAYGVIERHRELIGYFIPELKQISLPDREAFDGASPQLRFLSLFREKSPTLLDAAMRSLRSDTKTRELGVTLFENLERRLGTRYEIKCSLFEIGECATRELIRFSKIIGKPIKASEEELRDIIEKGECCSLKSLKLNGADLISQGFVGERIGEMLSLLLHSVMRGELENTKEALLSHIKRI